jgi:DNA-binding NarL/FixJ family response regulator
MRAARRCRLTRREIQVLNLIVLGESWKSTAGTLGISLSMVRLHSKNLLRKIGAQSPAAAVAKIFCPDTYAKA